MFEQRILRGILISLSTRDLRADRLTAKEDLRAGRKWEIKTRGAATDFLDCWICIMDSGRASFLRANGGSILMQFGYWLDNTE